MGDLDLQETDRLIVGYLREWVYVPSGFVVGVFAVIMVVTYVLVMSERFHRALAAMGGAVATVAAGKYFGFVYWWVPLVDAYLAWLEGEPPSMKPLLFTDQQVLTEMIDWSAIIIIISLMIIATVVSKSGLFEYIAVKMIKFSGGDPKRFFTYLCMLCFCMTAIIGNDPAFIVISALTLALTRAIGLNPRPYILGEVFVVHAAGVSSLIGNSVNIIASAHFNFNPSYFLSYTNFLVLGAPFSAAYATITFFIIQRIFKEELEVPEGEEFNANRIRLLAIDEKELIENTTLFRRTAVLLILTIAGFVIASLLSIPLYFVAFASALGFLVVGGVDTERVLLEVDWGLVVFLACILVVVGGVHSTGLLESVGRGLGSLTTGNTPATIFMVITVAGALSGIMDNVSVTTALLKVIVPLSLSAMVPDKILVWALIYGVNAGDSLTPTGGIASLLAISMLEKEGKSISWGEYIKIGARLCLTAFLLGTGMLSAFSILLGWTAPTELITMILSGYVNI